MTRRSDRPFDLDGPPPRLPVVGGPLDGKQRPAEGLTLTKPGWKGEYRRTTTCWQWTPPPSADNPVTEIVNTMGLASHPVPKVMADNADTIAKRIRRDGVQVIRRATVLAARGLPNTTTGTGSRTSDPTTSVERAVGAAGDDGGLTPPDPEWLGVDAELARLHRRLWTTATQLLRLYDRIQSHAGDDDPIPAGTGSCQRCGRFCRPTDDRPEDRIKSGFCNYNPGRTACYMQWVRQGRPDRGAFIRSFRNDAA